MRVRVLFFGRLKEIVGCAEDDVQVSEGSLVEDLFARYGSEFPRLGEFRASVIASVNQEYAEWNSPLHAGDEVAFLPPVSGGEHVAAAEDIYELVRRPIRTEEIIGQLKAPEDGAVVIFDGIVRNHSLAPKHIGGGGRRRTLYLEYEAYVPMALKKMREIGAELRNRLPVHRIAIVHRLGRLKIGETSVLVAVSSSHRQAAFDACGSAIDTLKRTVPIWKKEYFEGGAIWVEGELPSVKPFSTGSESTS